MPTSDKALPPALRFVQREHYSTGVPEQSSLTFVSAEVGFITVGDDSGAIYAIKGGPGAAPKVSTLGKFHALSGLEGASFNRRTRRLRVVGEDSSKVWEMALDHDAGKVRLAPPVEIGRLPNIGTRANKGFEGIDLLPAELSPDGCDWQLGIHEAEPRRVVLFVPATLEMKASLALPDSVKPALPDLSDATISPRGTLFVLSDQGDAFAEFVLHKGAHKPHADEWSLLPLAVTKIDTTVLPLAGAPRLQPEGIAFDDRGDLWVVCEGNSLLIRFQQVGG